MTKMKGGKLILKALCILCTLQILVTFYIVTKIYTAAVVRPDQIEGHRSSYEDIESEELELLIPEDFLIEPTMRGISRDVLLVKDIESIEIWGKSHIASYLWEHILGGSKQLNESLSIYHGEIQLKTLLKYKEGPGLTPETARSDVNNIVLVLNGRTLENVEKSKKWLNTLSKWPGVKVIIVMLGNEKCENKWILDYIYPKNVVRGVFLTYDDPLIDNRTFIQWPLGVASYRHFPPLSDDQIEASNIRKFSCNLQATKYENSSRVLLFKLLLESKFARQNCTVVERERWLPTETSESMNNYIRMLVESDLTLCPSGYNTETYRVYEALASGSVPVVEDQPSGGSCTSQGWRLLKKHHVPVLWIKSWNKLDAVFEKEKRISSAVKISRRLNVVHWYKLFRQKMKDLFLKVLFDKFQPD